MYILHICVHVLSGTSCQVVWAKLCGPSSPGAQVLAKNGCLVQLGFFSIVGIPLIKAMAELFQDAQPMLDGVLSNYHHWEAATPDADLPA